LVFAGGGSVLARGGAGWVIFSGRWGRRWPAVAVPAGVLWRVAAGVLVRGRV